MLATAAKFVLSTSIRLQVNWARQLSVLPSSNIDSSSQEAFEEIASSLQLHLDFISAQEEESLVKEITPLFRRIRYQEDHWDSAIVGYRETEVARWNAANKTVIDRILKRSKLTNGDVPLAYVHVLDLEAQGYIKAHVDAVRYCGDKVCGVSLLTDAVMRFVHTVDPKKTCDVLLSRRSLYIMAGKSRYDYTHEILPSKSLFKGSPVEKSRRIVIICRSVPKKHE